MGELVVRFKIFTFVIGEIILDIRAMDFVLKQVCLIEEKDDGSVGEPFGVTNGLKQHKCLIHLRQK